VIRPCVHRQPPGGETGARNIRLLMRLLVWSGRVGSWQVFDNSTGFRLDDGAVHSPDASLVRLERWQALTPELLSSSAPPSAPICWSKSPARVNQLPVASPPCAASWPPLGQWRPAGLVADPEQQAVESWSGEPRGEPQRLEGAAELSGRESFPGLNLSLAEIWEPCTTPSWSGRWIRTIGSTMTTSLHQFRAAPDRPAAAGVDQP